jgi:hypothetical protein
MIFFRDCLGATDLKMFLSSFFSFTKQRQQSEEGKILNWSKRKPTLGWSAMNFCMRPFLIEIKKERKDDDKISISVAVGCRRVIIQCLRSKKNSCRSRID